MAEIPIRRKEGRNIWPLLLGLIVLAAVLWFVLTQRHTTNTAATIHTDSAAAASAKVTRDSAGGAMANVKMDTAKKADTAKKVEATKKAHTAKRKAH